MTTKLITNDLSFRSAADAIGSEQESTKSNQLTFKKMGLITVTAFPSRDAKKSFHQKPYIDQWTLENANNDNMSSMIDLLASQVKNRERDYKEKKS